MSKGLKQKILLLVGTLMALGLGLWIANPFATKAPPIQFGCVAETRVIKGAEVPLMSGLIDPTKDYEALIDYYRCNPVLKGDLVLYQFSETMDPVIKVVRAVEGDKFELEKDAAGLGWNLLVNGDTVETQDGKPYFFGSPASKPTLSLYEKSRNNILGAGELIVLSAQPPGRDDSGVFGLVSVNDIKAMVRPKN